MMATGLIKICYRKIIDSNAGKAWDKAVFDATFKEFYMQAQQYDQQRNHLTFQELLKNNPKASNMHYLVSTAAIGYLRQLNERIPDVVNVWGRYCIPFKNFKFEILESHIRDKTQHKVAIDFYSEWLTWIGNVGDHLIFSPGDQLEKISFGEPVETETLRFCPNLSIYSYQGEKVSLLTSTI